MITASPVAGISHSLPMWGFVPALLIGVAFTAGGIALLRDYRGIVTWHSTKTTNMTWPLQNRVNRRAPWRWLPSSDVPRTREDAVANQLRTTRAVGAVVTGVGALLTVLLVVALAERVA